MNINLKTTKDDISSFPVATSFPYAHDRVNTCFSTSSSFKKAHGPVAVPILH